MLVHVVDASGTSGRDPRADLALVREEVRRWDGALLERPQLLVASKRDLAGGAGNEDPLPELREEAARLGMETVPVAAVRDEGLLQLKRSLLRLVHAARPAPVLAEQLGGR